MMANGSRFTSFPPPLLLPASLLLLFPSLLFLFLFLSLSLSLSLFLSLSLSLPLFFSLSLAPRSRNKIRTAGAFAIAGVIGRLSALTSLNAS